MPDSATHVAPGQPFDYTAEQQGIIHSHADTLSINAFAGTGKTATLVGFAEARPQQRMLYLAFNKAVAEAAKQRFPSHVDCRTSHSLAFATCGSRYKHKLGQPRAHHARDMLKVSLNRDEALLFADQALRTVSRFLMSGNPTLHLDHVDTGPLRFGPADVLAAARRFWDAMQDVQNAAMPMPHDGYLKLYQLSKPDLRKYDVILLDEAQDTNPCLFQIFNRQQTGRVLVGDAHQNIYAFRGAMNAMDRLDGERHALTASFRFGSAIADVANALLGTFKNEPLTLEGRGGPSTRGPASGDLQTVYLHRTNAGLIERGIGLLQANARARIHFVGGAYNDHFETLLDAWRLMDGEHGAIRDPFLRAFNSIGDLEDYAEATEDREIQARLSVVKKYTDRLPGLLDQLTAADEADPARAVASLTTAH
uniref:UvrD-helicase domain-containing protein n=1 Tax=uncultured Thiocystis sp. TaxID=1202134 RepID=UPI0025EA8C36